MADIFLSYGHIDNEDPENWVADLEDKLEKRLNVLFGKRANRIFIDHEQDGTRILDEMIKHHISEAKVLLSIASPAYFQSTYCYDEVFHFLSRAKDAEERRQLQSQMIIARKMEAEQFYDELQAQIYIDFYDAKKRRTLSKLYCQDDYIDRVIDLSNKLYNILRVVEDRPKIFLAKTPFDKRSYSRKLESQLNIEGFEVIASPIGDDDPDTWTSKTRDKILESECQMVIHIMGKDLDVRGQTSLQELQYQAVKNERDNLSFRHIVWIPRGSDSPNANQQKFFEELRNNHSRHSKNAELIEMDFEGFKNYLIQMLQNPSTKNEPEPESEPAPAAIPTGIANLGTAEKTPIYYLFPFKNESAAKAFQNTMETQLQQYQLRTVPNVSILKEKLHRQLLSECPAYLIFPVGNMVFLEQIAEDIQSRWKSIHGQKEMAVRQFNFENQEIILFYAEGAAEIENLIQFF